MARHRSRSASASDARWWLIVPAASSNPRAELDSSAEPYAIRQWCFLLPLMCPAPSARFNATDDAARISWSATGFSGPRTGLANSIAISAARCAIACAASFEDGVVMCSMVTSVVFMSFPQTVESNRGKGRPGDSPCPCPDWIRRLFPPREHRGGHHGAHPRLFRGRCLVTDTAEPHPRAPAAAAGAATETATAAAPDPTRSRPPGTVSDTDRAAPGNWVLRFTGLPSRSALVAPPFRLAALRWRVRSSSSGDFGHLRAPRRPSWWLWRTSPVGHSRGSPTRNCAHRNSNAIGTIPCTARPPVREVWCSAKLAPADSGSGRSSDSGSGRSSYSGRGRGSGSVSRQRRGPVRSPGTGHGHGHGVGHGPSRFGAHCSPVHRPAVAFGAARANPCRERW
jgi:hypothetical protein